MSGTIMLICYEFEISDPGANAGHHRTSGGKMTLRTCCFFKVIARSVPDYLHDLFIEVNTDADVPTREDVRKNVENVVERRNVKSPKGCSKCSIGFASWRLVEWSIG
jgi:hypothetical protein